MFRLLTAALIFATGAIAALLLAALAARTLLTEEVLSAYSVDETVERLAMAAQKKVGSTPEFASWMRTSPRPEGPSSDPRALSSFASRTTRSRCFTTTGTAVSLR